MSTAATAPSTAAVPAARERALDVALELFGARGYRGTSIALVAQRAGLSQSGLLHHFPTKAALLTAALAHRDARTTPVIVGREEPVGWAAFEGLERLVVANARDREWVELFVTISAEAVDPAHPAHEWAREHYAGITSWIAAALRAGVDAGEVSPEADVDAITAATVAVLDGLQVQWLHSGEPEGTAMVAGFRAFSESLRARWGTAG
ncbi:TetR/AcrR family transcriptional regulator [Paenibacillus sp. TRM 82003]|uniref:TetR/AcrR family transcriptional regulator n=1 Tax=Kineococcus sp. TRM81007 TaxID=2925831 RepID=UPI001F5AD04F|nr:TetR/AcrR family transcriptional regulator [Kineococcus sp. TRM81007]MCI2239933.1 TetR/AcrR family transcriptional regulator [Kineococcus sp. TRM81007]MCI3925762.1 TetR/AcrR family transcriptional regulator [Paenibacillus sp. TRM 82003]